MEPLSSIRHVTLLMTSPATAMSEVKKAGWVTPVLCLAATYGGLCSLPLRHPEALVAILKFVTAILLLQAIALWACGLPHGGRGTMLQALKVTAFLSLFEVLAYVYVAVFFPPALFIVVILIPVMVYIAVKSVHEYQNDDLAFRVMSTGIVIFYVLCVWVLPRLGMSLSLPL